MDVDMRIKDPRLHRPYFVFNDVREKRGDVLEQGKANDNEKKKITDDGRVWVACAFDDIAHDRQAKY